MAMGRNKRGSRTCKAGRDMRSSSLIRALTLLGLLSDCGSTPRSSGTGTGGDTTETGGKGGATGAGGATGGKSGGAGTGGNTPAGLGGSPGGGAGSGGSGSGGAVGPGGTGGSPPQGGTGGGTPPASAGPPVLMRGYDLKRTGANTKETILTPASVAQGFGKLSCTEVDGEIYCQGRVELKPSARVLGSLTAGTLIMHEGAFIDGEIHMVEESVPVATPASKQQFAAVKPLSSEISSGRADDVDSEKTNGFQTGNVTQIKPGGQQQAKR